MAKSTTVVPRKWTVFLKEGHREVVAETMEVAENGTLTFANAAVGLIAIFASGSWTHVIDEGPVNG